MLQLRWLFIFALAILVCSVWGLLISFWLPVPLFPETRAVAEAPGTVEITLRPAPSPTPTRTSTFTSTPTSTPTSTAFPSTTPTPTLTITPSPTPPLAPTPVVRLGPLPALYVDGPYLKRSDTQAPVWLKGINIEEFRQRNPHTFDDLYHRQGLGVVVGENWGINLLRVAIDPETVQAYAPEIDKLMDFAQQNGMYVLLVPFASATNPARSEQRMAVPDNLVVTAMGSLAARYKSRTNVLYGIWNEPHPDSIESLGYQQQWQVWMQAAIRVARSIRSRNPQAVLVVPGGTKWARDLTYYKDHPFPFDNVVYDAHDYYAALDYGYTRAMWTWMIGKYPLLIGELGGNPTNPFDPATIPYIQETFQIADANRDLVHYAMYALTSDGTWGIFTHDLMRMPKGNILLEDLVRYPPTRLFDSRPLPAQRNGLGDRNTGSK